MRLNKIEGLKPLLPNRKYGQKWEDLEFGINAQSLIERGDAPLAGYLKLTSGYWKRIKEAEIFNSIIIVIVINNFIPSIFL